LICFSITGGLQCLVAFELKADKFKPEQLGQLNFYLEVLDRDVKKPSENQSIGILLCKDKDCEVVEWIYRFIREDKLNGGSLYRHCRHRLKHRKRPIGAGVRNIPDRVSIKERPPEVEKREEFGHFEMDLIQNGKDFILTVIERKTRYLIMERLTRGKNVEEVAKTVIRLLKPLKNTLSQ